MTFSAAAEQAAASAAEAGLVAHWTFDEGRGDVARDVTGNGHDATLKHGKWVPSPRGHAVRFDSKDDAAVYGDPASMNMSGDMTLAVWVKVDPTVDPDTTHLLIGDTGPAVERNFSLYLHGPGVLRFEWTDGKTVAPLTAPSRLLNGTWKHIAVVANSTARHAAMYIDGQLAAEMPMPVPITKTVFTERRTGWFYNGFFTGELDDVRLYSRALTAAEVQGLFRAQADVVVGAGTMVYSGGTGPRAQTAVTVANFSREPRRVEFAEPNLPLQTVDLPPGDQRQVLLGEVPVTPVWRNRDDLFVCVGSSSARKLTVTTRRGDVTDVQQASLVPPSVIEPLQVVVHDPWQATLLPGKTKVVTADLKLALSAEQLRTGTLQVRMVSRATGQEVLQRQIAAPASALPLELDVRELPWGAYDLQVSFVDSAARSVVRTTRLATILPEGSQQVRVLNNLVSELMDARQRGLLQERAIEFMNPRDGWVWFRAAGDCQLKLSSSPLLAAKAGQPAAEAMRLLPAGKHVLQVTGTPTDLLVRAIPGLVYNVYPSAPMIQPFGAHTWQRLAKHTLPNTNMVESPTVDTPEHRDWLAQGKLWLANVQAPGLLDDKAWTEEMLLDLWLHPGKSTAWAERSGLDLAKLSGMQVDEYYGGAKSTQFLPVLSRSLAQLSEHPSFAGKVWIPFLAGKFGATPDNLLLKTVLGAGWPFSEEVYLGELPTEAENVKSIRGGFAGVATAYEKACPGSVRRMIFTPMYSCLPYCSANRCPQADFRVHLDVQMQVLATDPAFFGLWGVQPYRSNYVDEEILHCTGRLLRHYCIEGQTARMLADPYELKHVADPDFEQGLARWQAVPAEAGSVRADKFAGYGNLQGRYPNSSIGDTFAVMTRIATTPNILRQELQGLKAGAVYSLKVITGDYADLQAGKTRKDQQAIAIHVDRAAILDGGFSHPFPSWYGPPPFTSKAPFWMTYHWLRFRAQGPAATLSLSDWAKPEAPGGPAGQQIMLNFVELQPVLTD